jgi:hypothetical protein
LALALGGRRPPSVGNLKLLDLLPSLFARSDSLTLVRFSLGTPVKLLVGQPLEWPRSSRRLAEYASAVGSSCCCRKFKPQPEHQDPSPGGVPQRGQTF